MWAALEVTMMLTRSEAAATTQLAVEMSRQGNASVVTHALSVGEFVSLGPGRFVNRAMWTSATIDLDSIAAIIDLFGSLDLPPSVQVPGWANGSAHEELRGRGFRPDWSRSLLARPVDDLDGSTADHAPPVANIGIVDDALVETWLGVLRDGNETPPSAQTFSDEHASAAHDTPGSVDFLADLGAEPLACGSLHIVDGVGWLGGAATLPAARNRGLQARLVEHRIDVAHRRGARFVAATAVPGSPSERNLMRAGLDQVDVQTVWTVPS